RAKLSDFGLSKVKSETTTTGTSNSSVGTLAWMAPELLSLKAVFSQASDVYALGMVFWEISTRKRPFQAAASQEAIRAAVREGEREDIPTSIPPFMSSLIARCWAQRSQDRPPSRLIATEIMAIDTIDEPAQSDEYQYFSA
ncbi:MAG: protein kinase, partial [Methylococcales bacterium]|nr:protein kinase [Methylococcales bacterium]